MTMNHKWTTEKEKNGCRLTKKGENFLKIKEMNIKDKNSQQAVINLEDGNHD